MKNVVGVLIFLVLTVPALVKAEIAGEPATNTLTLKDLERMALQIHPGIKALEEQLKSSRDIVLSSLTPDQPNVGFEYNFFDGTLMFTGTQMLPSLFRYFPALNANRAGRDLASIELLMKRQDVLSGVKKSFIGYWTALKKKDLIKESIDAMKQFTSTAASLYALGKADQDEVLKFQTELERMKNMNLMADAETLSSLIRLSSTIGMTQASQSTNFLFSEKSLPVFDETGYVTSLARNLQSSNIPAIPELQALKLKEKIGLFEYRAAAGGWVPDLMAGVKIDTMRNTSLMLGATIPLWFWKQAADVRKAKHDYESIKYSLKEDIRNTIAEIKEMKTRLTSLSASLINYQGTILPLSAQALKLSETSYALGKGSFLDLSDSVDRYIKDRTDYYDMLNEAGSMDADVQRMTGQINPEARP